MKPSLSSIPVELCIKVVKGEKKHWSTFQLYLYLNKTSSGKILLNSSKIKSLSEELGLNPRTIKDKIKELELRKWIHFGRNINSHYIHGFDRVCKSEGIIKYGSKCELYIDNIMDFDIWLKHVGISYVIAISKNSKKEMFKSEPLKAPNKRSTTNLNTIPLEYFAKALNKSRSTISSWIKQVKEDTLLEANQTWVYVGSTRFNKKEKFALIKELNKELPGRYKTVNDKIYKRGCLQFRANLKFYYHKNKWKKTALLLKAP